MNWWTILASFSCLLKSSFGQLIEVEFDRKEEILITQEGISAVEARARLERQVRDYEVEENVSVLVSERINDLINSKEKENNNI